MKRITENATRRDSKNTRIQLYPHYTRWRTPISQHTQDDNRMSSRLGSRGNTITKNIQVIKIYCSTTTLLLAEVTTDVDMWSSSQGTQQTTSGGCGQKQRPAADRRKLEVGLAEKGYAIRDHIETQRSVYQKAG